jgi:hypothetical protein
MASDFPTLKSIRDNVFTVLKSKGINFTVETYDNIDNIEASILPHGQVRYDRVDYENTHGQRSSYAEVLFFIRVVFKNNNKKVSQDKQMEWTDLIRKGLTVDALNINDLVTSKLVSLVTTVNIEVDNTDSGGLTALEYEMLIRYREL